MSRKKWSKQVKARDDYTCLKCGLTKDEAAIEAHHIIKRPGKSKIKDGVTLCKWCHLMADMGKSAFSKFVKSDDGFYSELVKYIYNSQDDEAIYLIDHIPMDNIKKFLGLLSKFERKLQTIRSLAGKRAVKKIRVSNAKAKPGEAKKRPQGSLDG